MKRLLLFVSLALIFVSCKKENEAPKIGSTLQVENLATTQTPLAVLEKTALTDESLNKQELLKNLQSNPNIETATYSEDKYLIIKEKSNKIISVFPSISTGSLEDIGNREAGSLKFRSLKAAGSAGKVAIFNYFDGYGGLGRDGQNKIVEDLVYLFEQHDYQVDYYNYERFTRSNVSKVVGQSEKYAAIIVMSHGFVNTSQGRTIAYYALGEKYDDRRDTPWEYNYNPFADTYQERKDPRPWYYRLWSGSEYNAVDEVNSLATARNCILYIGACEAFKKGATSRYASSPQTYIGWDDVNKYSQAHAGLLFNRMLQDEMSLEAALSTLWKSEDTGAKLVYGGNTEIRLKSKQSEVRNSIRQVHFKDLSRGLNGTEVFFKKFSTFLSGHYTYTLEGSLDPQYAPKYLYVALKPISRFSKTHLFNKIKIKKDGTFKKKILIPNNLRGIYNLIAGANKDLSDVISISPPKSFIYSTSFQENSAQVLSLFDGNSIEVSINGEEVQSVSLSQGEEQSLVIEEYEDYHYSISVDKPALLDAQISSMNILLRGKAEGQATLTIRCKETGGQTILPISIGQEQNPISPNDYELSPDGLTLLKWKNQNTKHLDMNRDSRLKEVTGIGEKAFERCISLTSINISNSIISIGELVFWGCYNLTSINIPNSVTSIGKRAFDACHSLTNINIPNSVTSVEQQIFWNCSSLKEINIPNSVTSIKYGAFLGCSSLKEINIPNSVTNIGHSAFRGCSSLKNINIPNSVISIGEEAFMNCGLTNINIPNSIKRIDSSVFSGCSSLTKINIPSSVTSIRYRAFKGCSSLKNIDIPNSVTSIGGYVFEGCSNLTNINIPSSVKDINFWGLFKDCSNFTNINIPSSVTSVGGYAFEGCSSLTDINIPNSVTSISYAAFRGCSSLMNINIPNSVVSIGERVFENCSRLTSITMRANVVIAYKTNVLNETPALQNIYVPAHLVEEYKQADGWKDFADKIKAIP